MCLAYNNKIKKTHCCFSRLQFGPYSKTESKF